MTKATPVEVETTSPDGSVTGAPRRWLQLEGATLLVGSLVAFSTTHRSWWLVPLVLLLPEVFAAGYLGGSRVGAHLYNIAHATPLPVMLVGFGLKYSDRFQHTHLGSDNHIHATRADR